MFIAVVAYIYALYTI